jgi:hypothetical protein
MEATAWRALIPGAKFEVDETEHAPRRVAHQQRHGGARYERFARLFQAV